MPNMDSDTKTLTTALLDYINSDLFTLSNISSVVQLTTPGMIDEITEKDIKWETVISLLPLKFYKLIESYPDMYTVEKFDKRYIRNPKMCAEAKYGMTNMWRPLMIVNRCPNISRFDFE